jgi:hypothetical protein
LAEPKGGFQTKSAKRLQLKDREMAARDKLNGSQEAKMEILAKGLSDDAHP